MFYNGKFNIYALCKLSAKKKLLFTMVWPWENRNQDEDEQNSMESDSGDEEVETDEENTETVNELIELSHEFESHLGVDFHQYTKSTKLLEELADLYMELKQLTQQYHTQCKRRYKFRKALPDYQKLIENVKQKIAMLVEIRTSFLNSLAAPP